jgi:hypothetical protein
MRRLDLNSNRRSSRPVVFEIAVAPVPHESGYALRDLCRGCYREMRHADRVAHFVNW